MKKTILFFAIIATGLIATSCLGDISGKYEDKTYVFIEMADNGVMYGKTISRISPIRFITSIYFSPMDEGTIKFMSYNWDEEDGTTKLIIDGQEYNADNVNLREEPVEIVKTVLVMNQANEDENLARFVDILTPLYADAPGLMNDYWIIPYEYKAKKGQTPKVEFFMRDNSGDEDDIVIDIKLTLEGTPEGTSLEKRSDAVAVNMRPLRTAFEGESLRETKTLLVRFRFYNEELPDAFLSYKYQFLVKAN